MSPPTPGDVLALVRAYGDTCHAEGTHRTSAFSDLTTPGAADARSQAYHAVRDALAAMTPLDRPEGDPR